MSVYVGELFRTAITNKWPFDYAAHLFADSENELHIFAKKIGLYRRWAQFNIMPHYDVTIGKRIQAIANGAIKADRHIEVKYIRKWRNHEKRK
jgi:hypothetical protein